MDRAHAVATLPNGTRVLSVPMPDSPLFTVRVFVRVGFDHEADVEEYECAHFLEHMCAKFTSRSWPDAEAVQEEMAEMGASKNAHTTTDSTEYFVTCLPEHARRVLELVVATFAAFAPDQAVFDQERNAVCEELRTRLNRPWCDLDDQVGALLFRGHPREKTHRLRLGNADTIPLQRILAFRDRAYVGGNVIVGLAGALPEGWEAIVRAAGQIPPGPLTATPPPPPAPSDRLSLAVANPSVTGVHLSLTFAAPVLLGSDEAAAVDFACEALAGGLGAVLYRKLRTEMGLVYFVACNLFADPYHEGLGTVELVTETQVGQGQRVVEAVNDCLRRVVENGLDEADYRRVQADCSTSLAQTMCSTDPDRFLSHYGRGLMRTGRVRSLESVWRQVRAVTPERADAALRKVFGAPPAVAAIGSPEVSERECRAFHDAAHLARA